MILIDIFYKVKNVFCTFHCHETMFRTETVWFTRNPTWTDEFTFSLTRPNEVLKVFINEERKKGSHKKIGEVKISTELLNKNEVVEKWYPILTHKGETVGDIRIRATYSVEIILPSQYYTPLLDILLDDKLVVVKMLAKASKDKTLVAQELINIFYARNKADYLIQRFIDDELADTSSPDVLFRSNSVCTKLIDFYMKITGTDYLKKVLTPIIEMITKQTQAYEIQKDRLKEGEDYQKNVEKIISFSNITLQRIFQSSIHTPPAIRRVLTYLYYSTPRFLDNKNGTIKYLAVTSFMFLRFFVPALLNPKYVGLTNTMPDGNQLRILTLIAGLMQKIANLTKYRENDLYMNLLNDFLDSQLENTKQYIEFIVDTRKGDSFLEPPTVAPVQADRYLASLLRHFTKCKDKFIEEAATSKEAERLLNVLKELDEILEKEKEIAESEEIGIMNAIPSVGYKDIDLLVSKVIETDIVGVDGKKVVKRKTSNKEEPVTKGRSFSIAFKKLLRRKSVNTRNNKVNDVDFEKRVDVLSNSQGFRERFENSPLRNRGNAVLNERIPRPIKFRTKPKDILENSNIDEIPDDIIEEDEEEEIEDVEVTVLNQNRESLEPSVKNLDKLIDDINSIPKRRITIEDLEKTNEIPEFKMLDTVIRNIRRTVTLTTPKVSLTTDETIICHYCKDLIEEGSKYFIAMDKVYHEHHMLCTICSKDVSEVGFHYMNDLPYCIDCYTINYGKCPICAHCYEPILSKEFVFATGKNWHIEHFFCTICKSDFKDGVFYNVDDLPYCHLHRSGKGESEIPVCSHCNEYIYDESYVEALDQKYHSDHFFCDLCQKTLLESFVTFETEDGTKGKACESHF